VDLLLNGAFLPTTGVIGFVERPLDSVLVNAVCRLICQQRGVDADSLRREPVDGPLESAMEHLRPLSSDPSDDRYLLCPTTGAWTAWFDSSATGGDPRPLAVHLPDLLSCRTLVVLAVPQPGSPARGSRLLQTAGFSLAAPTHAGWADAVRSVTVVRGKGGTEVTAYGEPLAAEAGDRSDDLDLEQLDRYLTSLGVRAFDGAAYFPPGSRGLLVEQ
jgi:hypothetical protein